MSGAPPRLAHDDSVPRTVFVAPGRAARPIEIPGGAALAECPFCAGHELLTPHEVARVPAGTAAWVARIIPNRYPVVERGDDAPSITAAHPAADGGPADGVHEVLVESPHHAISILDVEPAAWRVAWELCRDRLAALATRGDLAWTTVFKNSGPAAGASLAHVHSQIVGLGFVPPAPSAEFARAGADPFGRHLADALAEERVVATAGDLVALVPPAPRQPYETWIVPRSPRAWFHADAPGAGWLAELTHDVVGRLHALVPGADYNWWLHQAPLTGPVPRGWRWHLEILPRLSGFAGFELATGCHITTAGAADSARLLRAAFTSSRRR